MPRSLVTAFWAKVERKTNHNAILRAGAAKVRGASLYVWPLPPCHRCACDIVQAGIKRVVVPLHVDVALQERWRESLALSRELFAESNISLVGITHA